jgi:3-oxoacyl-[acyl-carrier-protein] synthase-3
MPSLSAPLPSRLGVLPGASRHASILSTGAFTPDAILGNAELERLVDTSDAWILERTGIRERRRAGAGMTASMMGAEAGRRAMEAAGVAHVDALIVATCSADTRFPSAAALMQRSLGMPGIPAFDINAACSGYVYALVMSRALISAGTAETVLVVGAEALTTLVDYTDRGTCVLLGDGAGASVVGATDGGGIVAARWGADGNDADLIYYGVRPDDPDSGDAFRMAGKGTFRLAVERLAETATQLCADAGWAAGDVDLVVPHQANLRIIEAAAKRAGVSMDRVYVNVDRYGNTSAASIPLALAEANAAGRLHAGDRVLCIAFGSGLTWGGVALEWNAQSSR